MTVYVHNNIKLDLQSTKDNSASLYVDGVLRFKGNRKSAASIFMDECGDKAINKKFAWVNIIHK